MRHFESDDLGRPPVFTPVVAVGMLTGWVWALLAGAVLLGVAGVILVRTAALTRPEPAETRLP